MMVERIATFFLAVLSALMLINLFFGFSLRRVVFIVVVGIATVVFSLINKDWLTMTTSGFMVFSQLFILKFPQGLIGLRKK